MGRLKYQNVTPFKITHNTSLRINLGNFYFTVYLTMTSLSKTTLEDQINKWTLSYKYPVIQSHTNYTSWVLLQPQSQFRICGLV